jgi:hypothetical protein
MDFLPRNEVYKRRCEEKDIEAPVPPAIKEVVGGEEKEILMPKAQPWVHQEDDAYE